MATIDSPSIIRTILENNGIYPGDPQMSRVYSYISTYTNKKVYAIYPGPTILWESEFVRNPILLFSKEDGLTEAGRMEIEYMDKESIKPDRW